MRDNGHVQNRAVYVAIGVNLKSVKEVLGLRSSANEGEKFWFQVLTEVRNRGRRPRIYRPFIRGSGRTESRGFAAK
jgi:transposase-like protein